MGRHLEKFGRKLDKDQTAELIDIVSKSPYSLVFTKLVQFNKEVKEKTSKIITDKVHCIYELLLANMNIPYKKILNKIPGFYLAPVEIELDYDSLSGKEAVNQGFDKAHLTSYDNENHLQDYDIMTLQKMNGGGYNLYLVDIKYQIRKKIGEEDLYLAQLEQQLVAASFVHLF